MLYTILEINAETFLAENQETGERTLIPLNGIKPTERKPQEVGQECYLEKRGRWWQFYPLPPRD
jgi:hypothetical protein